MEVSDNPTEIIETTEGPIDVDLPNVKEEELKQFQMTESPVNSDGSSYATIPEYYYLFTYATDANGNIVGMNFGIAGQNGFKIDIDSTALAVVMSLPINWELFNITIEDLLPLIKNASLYPTLKSQIDDTLETNPAALISEEHLEIWETAIKIIKEITGNLSLNYSSSSLINQAKSFPDMPAYIKDISGDKVSIINRTSVPYGISAIDIDSGSYNNFTGIKKRPWWTPGKSWLDYILGWFGTEKSVDYSIGAGNFVVCLAKIPYRPFLFHRPSNDYISSRFQKLSGTSGEVNYSELVEYFDTQSTGLKRIKIDALTKGSVGWGFQLGLSAAGLIPGYGDVVSIGGDIVVNIANSAEIGLLDIPTNIFTSGSTYDNASAFCKLIVKTAQKSNSYARILAQQLYGDARMTANITAGASKLSKIFDILSDVLIVGDVADILLIIKDTEYQTAYLLYSVTQDSSGNAQVDIYTESITTSTVPSTTTTTCSTVGAFSYSGTLESTDGRSIRSSSPYYTDLYTFTLCTTTQVQISMTSTFNGNQIFLYGGSIPTDASYKGFVYNGNIINEELPPGTYCIEATSLNSSTTGDYGLTSTVDLTESKVPYQYKDYSGTLESTDGRSIRSSSPYYTDLYTFTLSTTTWVQIWMDSTFNGNQIFLYGGSIPTDASYKGFVYNGNIINEELPPGTYCIEATSLNSSTTGDYGLTSTVDLTESKVPYQYKDYSGTLESTDGRSIRSSSPYYTDLYTFTLSTTTWVQIWMDSTFNGNQIFLYGGSIPTDASYKGFVYNGNIINEELPPGTYCIEATSLNSSTTGDYGLTSTVDLTQVPY